MSITKFAVLPFAFELGFVLEKAEERVFSKVSNGLPDAVVLSIPWQVLGVADRGFSLQVAEN
ncbi:MAG: hypothetical protein ACLP05_04315 [Candidatus Kryptoniota bacterium]